MRIQSFASKNLFWRAFDPNDGVCMIGVQEGIVSPNQHVDWNHPKADSMKLELKVTDIHGTVIMPPGRVLANTDGVEVHDSHYTVQTHVHIPTI